MNLFIITLAPDDVRGKNAEIIRSHSCILASGKKKGTSPAYLNKDSKSLRPSSHGNAGVTFANRSSGPERIHKLRLKS